VTGSLLGQRILVTRPGEVGRELAITLAAAGAEGRWAPAIDIAPVGEAELRAARAAAAEATGIIVSSPRVLDFLWPTDAALPAVPLHLVGRSTADSARARGLSIGEVSDAGLADLVRRLERSRNWRGERLFWCHGDLSDEEEMAPLVAAGAQVESRVVYRTDDVYAREGFATELLEGLHAVVVASPSAADALARAFTRCAPPGLFAALRFAAIGPTTAAALSRHGASHIDIAAEPSNPGLVAILRR
jgi:uroporphyrinogen-III synthase